MKQCDLSPEVITLGTYRVIERSRPSFKMLGVVPPVELAYLLPTGVSSQQRRLRYPDSVRKHIYQYLIARIREKFPGTAIGLCKETNAMRAELGYTLAIR
jgi:hypothetical protein